MYIKILIFLFIFVFNCVFGTVEEQWQKFKLDFNKNYTDSEEKHSFEVFKTNLEEIENHNKLYEKGIVTYKKRITKFADLTSEEFIKIYQLRQGFLRQYEYPINTTSNSTGYLNWKEKGAVTKVKDQGICGACWIFCAIGVIEGHYFRQNDKLITLSEQNIIDCYSRETCKGGFPSNVIDYLSVDNNGINIADDYPHKGFKSLCRYDKSKKVKLDVLNYTVDFYTNEKELKRVLENHGPIGIAISANGNWRLYDSGIWFENRCCEDANHAVLLVGYGTENGRDYWLIKNSYGKEWGLNGYIKIARNVGKNYCGLETFAFFIHDKIK